MGFFSSLMSKELIGSLAIKFYNENEASVECSTKASDKMGNEENLILFFLLYYAKILFNLNQSEHADNLIINIQKITKNILEKEGSIQEENILKNNQSLINSKSYETKKYLGDLYKKTNGEVIIETYASMGEERYYVPMSVIIFLQYLIKNLSEESLAFLFLSLQGMNKHYIEYGDYSKIQSVTEAVMYGNQYVTQVLERRNNK